MDLGKLVILLGGLVLCLATDANGQWNDLPSGGQFYAFSIPMTRYSIRTITLYISSESTANVQIMAPFVSLNETRVVRETTLALPLSSQLQHTTTTIARKGVIIKSDVSVYVHVLVQGPDTSDSFLAKPINADSKEFYVFTYKQQYNMANEFVVVAPSDNTEVHIKIKTSSGSVNIAGQQVSNGQTIKKVLNSYDSLQVQSDQDITGTYINSSKPISVLSGNPCMSISHYCDFTTDQLIPTFEWKTDYITSFLDTRGVAVLRVLASKDNTIIKINNQVVTTLARGAFYERSVSSATALYIQGSEPISVVQFNDLEDAGSYANPFMVVVPAMEQFMTSYTFEVPTGFRSNFLVLYVESDKTNGFLVDGRVATIGDVRTTHLSDTGKYFSVGRIGISPGKHTLTHTTSGTRFGALLYGLTRLASYGFYLGYSDSPVCTPPCLNNGKCIAGNTCHCQLGFRGQQCEIGAALANELKPRLFTLIDGEGNGFMDPMAWYADPPISDTNKVCYVKILVKNSTIETLAAAISSTTDGVEYGNFTTGPLDSTAGVTGLTRFACLEVRCPFVTLDGTPRDTVIDVSLTGNNSEACRIRDHSAHVTNFTIQSEDDKSEAFQFVLEVGKNYGPYYGVYMAIGSRDKAKFLAERKCGSGNEYDYESYNPSAGVLAEYSC